MYVMAFWLPMMMNFLPCAMSVATYSLKRENGGLVAMMSASSISSRDSSERKSPSPESSVSVFSPDLNSSATSTMSTPPSPVMSYTSLTTAL